MRKGIASPALVDAWLAADEARRRAQTQATLRAEQRKLSDRIGALKRLRVDGADAELDGLMTRGDELKAALQTELHRRHGPGEVAHVRHRDVDAQPRAVRRDPFRQRAARLPVPAPRPALSATPTAEQKSPGPQFCFTLNNTAIACPRILISVMELYQETDGGIAVPDALKPYMAGLDRITP